MVNKIPAKHASPFQNFARLMALAGLLLLILSGIIYIVNQSWGIYAQIGAGIGLALLLGAVLLRPDAVRTFLAGRPVKYASHAVVKSAAFLGILILINILAVKYGGDVDLTKTGQFTLRHIWLTPMQLSVTVVTTLIIIPLAILLVAMAMWWKRR